MRAMKDSGVEWIGEIPQDWGVIKNKYLIDFLYSGGTPKATEESFYCVSDGTPFVSISDMSNFKYVTTTKKQLTEAGVKDKQLMVLPSGTILYSLYATVGAVSELRIEATISQAILAIRLNHLVNKEFYKYSLLAMRDYIYSNASGNTQFNLNVEKVRNFYFVFPDLNIQQIIADFLDSKCSKIDSIIEKQQAVIEKLKEYKLSIITEAVTKGLNSDVEMKDSGVEWIGEVPKNWTTYRLKYLLQERKDAIRVGPFGSQLTSKDFVDDGFWVYTQRNVLDNDFTKTDTFITYKKFNDMKGFSVEAGDVLVTTRGTGTTGHIVKVPKDFFAGIIHPCLMKFKLNENECLYDYLYYVFEFAKYLRTQIEVANNTSSLPVLYSNTLCNLYVVVPPKDIQCDLIRWLNDKSRELDGLIEKRKLVIDKLTEYKKSLIYEVVTGKKEV